MNVRMLVVMEGIWKKDGKCGRFEERIFLRDNKKNMIK